MFVAVGSGVWAWSDVQAVSANNMIMNVKILFIFSFFLLFQIFVISIFSLLISPEIDNLMMQASVQV
jgi:multisubunit Na+/H+ antiporter MnhG subunit